MYTEKPKILPALSGLTGPPGKPGVPDIVDWDVDRVDLKWDAPKDTGGAPITKYIIEKKERYGSWETIHESEVRRDAGRTSEV